MSARRRRKRDSASNLYRQCQITGNCPPDVKNKIEGNTLADKILKYGSGAVFLGGLGIATGESATSVEAGSTGINVGREVTVGRRPFRTHGPIDRIGVTNIGPRETPFTPPSRAPVEVDVGVGHIEPSDPSVLTPIDVPPAVVDDVITLPIPEITLGGDTLGGDTSAIIEVTPRAPDNTIMSRTQYNNPSFDISLFNDSTAGELSAADQITVTGGGGTVVGEPSLAPEWEEVPLVDFSAGVSRKAPDLEEETSFTTSTPEGARPKQGTRRRLGLYSRATQQVEVTEPEFLERPGRLVSFGYTNPAYDPEISEIFESDLREAEAAPSSAFQDVVRLGRVQLSRARTGLVRVSRLGTRASMQTRSGLKIGARTHFYTDLSPILPEESIEEIPLAETSLQSTVVDAINDAELEETLLDTLEDVQDVASNLQLIIDGPMEIEGPTDNL
uniref:Minor capsid protein L2 n=1 Tax=Plecotus austriacus papillomavirus 1 TaxID=3140011 RepID=A0AAU6S4V6_9PAPI